jgi:hypothetical protein
MSIVDAMAPRSAVSSTARVALMTAACATVACSSHYMPRGPHRVSVMMADGKLVYVRDGAKYPQGFGGGLVDAVRGNPAAEAAANEFRDHNVYGLVGVIAGAAAMLGGVTWLEVSAFQDQSGSGGRQYAAPLLLTVAGLVVMAASAGYAAAGAPYQWDAINIFNDSADAPLAPPRLGPPSLAPPSLAPPLPGAQGAASLSMRPE